MKQLLLIVALVVGLVMFTACGETTKTPETDTKTATQTTTTTPATGDFEKYAQLDWVKIGVLKGWTDTIDTSQKTIKLSDGATTIDISYTISDTPENYATNAEGGASGKVTKDKVKFGGIDFIRLSIEYGGSISGVRLFAPYASDGTSIIDINGPITTDIEKMLNSVEIK